MQDWHAGSGVDIMHATCCLKDVSGPLCHAYHSVANAHIGSCRISLWVMLAYAKALTRLQDVKASMQHDLCCSEP